MFLIRIMRGFARPGCIRANDPVGVLHHSLQRGTSVACCTRTRPCSSVRRDFTVIRMGNSGNDSVENFNGPVGWCTRAYFWFIESFRKMDDSPDNEELPDVGSTLSTVSREPIRVNRCTEIETVILFPKCVARTFCIYNEKNKRTVFRSSRNCF